MKNLSAEMARLGVSNADIQSLLGCSSKTVTNKLNDATEFSISEAIKVRNVLFPGYRLEYLFARSDSAQGSA